MKLSPGKTETWEVVSIVCIAVCEWIFAFILTICVVMSNDHLSPALMISFSTPMNSIRTVFLVSVLVITWVSAYSLMRGGRWSRLYTTALGLFLLATGLQNYSSGNGPLSVLLGGDSLGRTSSLVFAIVSAIVLALLAILAIRRRGI
ncbi:hypothetical protein [Paraburkholderia sp.]|uniref:hypothetical protein n=1 Tax=Paraburkholderia sp. TaxID=1926495 RepID=UPI003D6F91D1